VERLCADNEVVVIDNESTGKMNNLKTLNTDDIEIFIDDINAIDLKKVFTGVDYIFHEAALPSVPRSIKDPLRSNESNITGTLKVLLAARDCEVNKLVFASSSSVYGDTPTLPKVETMSINPKSPYAVTKATGELYCQNFTEVYDLPTVCLRYFNVFGPRQDPYSQYSAVIPKFINAIKKGKSPIIYGDGEQSRDFTYVEDVVNANLLAAESKETGVYNIACGRRWTLNELVEQLNQILDNKVEPLYTDLRPGDIKHSLADITKAKTFGYNPKGEFKDELRKTVNFFQ
jgi:UDP-glucose 4-epimerase